MNKWKGFQAWAGLVRGQPLSAILISCAVVVLAASSCHSFGRESRSGWGIDERGADQFVLQVENQNFADARLYAHWNGDRRRIGVVGGNRTEHFTLNWDGRQLRVEVDFLAGGSIISPSIMVSRGDTVVFQIPAGAG
jgi:hypothetical protein